MKLKNSFVRLFYGIVIALLFGGVAYSASPNTFYQGGTNSTTRQGAINALTDVSSATNEAILTKDTSTGNAIFKAAPSGMVYPGAGIPISTGSAWSPSITDNHSNWDTAYSWGDHASAGYLISLNGALLSTGATTGATSQAQAFTNGITTATINGIALTSAATGFTIAGGTTSKTLTLDADISASALAPLASPVFTTNVGIGITPNQTMLHVASDALNTVGKLQYNATDTTPPRVFFLKSRGTAASPTILSNDDGVGSIIVDGHDGSNYRDMASIEFNVDGTFSTGQRPPSRISFWTAAVAGSVTERMRITNDGYVGIGVTPESKLDVNGGARIRAGNSFLFFNDDNSSYSGIRVDGIGASNNTLILSTNADALSISAAGVITAANLAGTGSRAVVADANGVLSAPTSDARLKTNITPIDSNTAIAMLYDPNIQGVNFNWVDPKRGTDTELGFTAQMFEPYQVKGLTFEDNGIKGLNYEKITTLLWEQNRIQESEIQELNDRVNELESKCKNQ